MVENGGKTKVLLINTTNGESDFIHLLHRLRWKIWDPFCYIMMKTERSIIEILFDSSSYYVAFLLILLSLKRLWIFGYR